MTGTLTHVCVPGVGHVQLDRSERNGSCWALGQSLVSSLLYAGLFNILVGSLTLS